MQNQPQQPQQIQIKAKEDDLKGVYSNAMQVSHSREEFVLDFLNLVASQGTLNARIITSPGHLKRIAKALQENIQKYENAFGKIKEAAAPQNEVGFKA